MAAEHRCLKRLFCTVTFYFYLQFFIGVPRFNQTREKHQEMNSAQTIPLNSKEFSKVFNDAQQRVANVGGYLTEKERALLVLLASCPSSVGSVLEIGAYQGLSTSLIAVGMERTPGDAFHTCDPWSAPGVDGQDVRTNTDTFHQFHNNLAKAGVSDRVVVHRAFSKDLASEWTEPLRFLWIDGDHSIAGTENDYDNFARHVAPGGIIAFHDVLHHHPGPSLVFATRVLISEKWGACGFSGSIGWAQRVRDRSEAVAWRQKKITWFRHLVAISRGSVLDGQLRGWARLRFRWSRSRIPHGYPDFDSLVGAIGADKRFTS